jgi:hypothetical protein
LLIVASLLWVAGAGAACGKRTLTGTADGGGGRGGTSGAGGAGPITSCPTATPASQTGACSGSFSCQFNAGCTCHGCCTAFWSCVNGTFKQTDFNDICAQGRPCDDGGAGAGGTGSGGGGASGGSGMTLADCPASQPPVGNSCIGNFSCNYDETCVCGTCCQSIYHCANGRIERVGVSDACLTPPPCDAGPQPIDGAFPVCTFGADQSCNDNPALSSIHGHCTNAGTCTCTFDAGTNPATGRCL